MAACGAFFMGQVALFIYVRPFVETVTHVGVSALSPILLGLLFGLLMLSGCEAGQSGASG
jgi:predicted MFS family arabinose efflux permease